jgi:hypothetical protein
MCTREYIYVCIVYIMCSKTTSKCNLNLQIELFADNEKMP